MQWNYDFDVKEYRPKKKSGHGTASVTRNSMLAVPGVTALKAGESFTREGVAEFPGGVMMTTSEILDFSEGSNSY